MHRNKPKSFEDIAVGDTAAFTVPVTEEIHASFTSLSGDHSPIHCDEAFSASTPFKKPIGYAFLLTSFLSRLYGEYLPGGSSICVRQQAEFLKPFYVGDTITVRGTVESKSQSTKLVDIKAEMFRSGEHGEERIFKGTGTVQVVFSQKKG